MEKKTHDLLRKHHRKRPRKGSTTSTKFLPDWINDLECEWAHSHDFRNYSKPKPTLSTATAMKLRGAKSNALRSPKRKHSLKSPRPLKPSAISLKSKTINKPSSKSLVRTPSIAMNTPTISEEVEIEMKRPHQRASPSSATIEPSPSKTSPVFESPALSPDGDHGHDDHLQNLSAALSPMQLVEPMTPIDDDGGDHGDGSNVALTPLVRAHSDSNSRSVSLSQGIPSNALNGNALRPLTEEMQTQSVSESNGSGSGFDDGDGVEFEASLQSSGESESMSHAVGPPDDDRDQSLQREVCQHLERFNINELAPFKNIKGRTDSLLPAELKQRYNTKLKQIGKIKGNDGGKEVVPSSPALTVSSGTTLGLHKKKRRKWHRRDRRKKGKSKGSESVSGGGGVSMEQLERTKSAPPPSHRAIDEEHEIDHEYFGDEQPLKTVLDTPSREQSLSPNALGIDGSDDAEEDALNAIDDALSFKNKARSLDEVGMSRGRARRGRHHIIKSADEKTLQEMQAMSVKQPRKPNRSGGMFSRLFSKLQNWTDKNHQAFTSYSQILKTAITQQV